MKKEIVIIFESHFKKEDISILLNKVIDLDFNGEVMIRFLNENGVLTAINGVDGWGNNIREKVEFKTAEIYYKM